jgi:peptidyl-prolyl cis-trans isomerase SurA
MTMRIATTLMLGAALLAGAAADAQETKSVPAVPPRQSLAVTRTAAAQPVSRVTAAAPAVPAKPEAAKAEAPKPDAEKSETEKPDAASPVQEAKNNDAAVIDAANPNTGNDSDSVIATVNDESISDFELRQRVALYLALQGGGVTQEQLTPEQKTHIRGQILEVLEAEKLQLQEAVKKKITVSPVEVDRRLNGMIQDYHFTMDQLRQNLKKAGASEDALRSQITASLAWQKAVQDEYGDQVNITPDMITAELQRNAEGADKTHYHVLEIFLPVDSPEQNEKVKKDAEEVERQLHQGAPFPVVARQFSQHPTAATGGDMGWVSDGQLASELNTALSKMEVGAISDPIRSAGGWYIVALRERQEPMGTKIAQVPTGPTGPAGTLPLARLLFPADPRAPKAQLEQIMKVAEQIHDRYVSCAQLEQLQKQMNGTVYMDLGEAKLAELSPQIQEGLKNTHPGEAATPFMDDAGIELIGRCDKRIEVKTAYVMPTKQQVEDQLFQNQISTMARRYLRDLKREANIQLHDNTKPDALIR